MECCSSVSSGSGVLLAAAAALSLCVCFCKQAEALHGLGVVRCSCVGGKLLAAAALPHSSLHWGSLHNGTWAGILSLGSRRCCSLLFPCFSVFVLLSPCLVGLPLPWLACLFVSIRSCLFVANVPPLKLAAAKAERSVRDDTQQGSCGYY